MPTGPKGEKRPADVTGNAVLAGVMSFTVRMCGLAVLALPLSACAPPPPPPAVYVAPAPPRPWVNRLPGWPPCPAGYHLGPEGGRCWLNTT